MTPKPDTENKPTCEWLRDGDGGYYVKCGDFRVSRAGQVDHDAVLDQFSFRFCPYCGGRLKIRVNDGKKGDQK